mmetsp:Transcript_10024/g.23891  ORF Transcript_10024/g.23891 Transcript_10024/m.23891 type:complete len:206 (-) Transcript_10024:459-1076(-)
MLEGQDGQNMESAGADRGGGRRKPSRVADMPTTRLLARGDRGGISTVLATGSRFRGRDRGRGHKHLERARGGRRITTVVELQRVPLRDREEAPVAAPRRGRGSGGAARVRRGRPQAPRLPRGALRRPIAALTRAATGQSSRTAAAAPGRPTAPPRGPPSAPPSPASPVRCSRRPLPRRPPRLPGAPRASRRGPRAPRARGRRGGA